MSSYIKIFFSNFFLLLLVCILCGCRQNRMDTANGIAVIDVERQIGNYHEIAVSEIVSELEYIPLETDKDFLVGTIRQIIVTPTHIFCWGEAGGGGGGYIIGTGQLFCYVFGRDGHFITQIGRVGQGPGEYTTILGMSIDEKSQTLYLETTRGLFEYSWEGVFRRSINRPLDMYERPVENISFVRENLFIGHAINNRGNEIHNYILFNDSGQVIKAFDNYIQFKRERMFSSHEDGSIQPFKVKENLYVKEYLNDTLFFLNKQDELIPQFVFYLGKYAFPLQLREIWEPTQAWEETHYKDRLIIPNWSDQTYPMIGTPEHIFFHIWRAFKPSFPVPKGVKQTMYVMGQVHYIESYQLLGLYDIAKQTIRMIDTDPVSRMPGLINDLDGGMSFWPRYYTSENELVDICQSYEMKEILTEKYFAAHEIKNPQAHQKLKELVKKLDLEDNPVIVIGKLK